MARVLAMPEDSFGQLVLSVERDPLFRKFLHTDDPRRKLFSYQRFPRTGLTSGFLEMRDDVSPATGDADIQSLLDEKRDLIDLCHRIGRSNFETYFLYADRTGSPETIAKACGLTPEEAKRLLDLTTQIGIRAEFYNAPNASPANYNAFSRVAHIERDGDVFSIRYTSLRYGRGRYAINYEKMEALKKDPSLTPADKRALRKLVQSMELVNARRSTMNQILDAITEHQKNFLVSGKEEDLKDFTQDRLAARLGVHPSTVCRAVASKAIIAGFNVRPAGKAASLAEENKIEIRLYSIIYNAVDDVKGAMEGLLPANLVEKQIGKAEVRQIFKIRGLVIAGSYVIQGTVKRTANARLVRDNVVVWSGKLAGLKRIKDDAKEVAEGFECGISLEGYTDIKEKDVVECYEIEEVKQKL